MTDRTSADHLEDILDAINKALLFTEDYAGYEDFAEDDRAVFAVIRALEVIGEATKRLPDKLRAKHPGVPWASMAGMRDKLIHDYVNVDRRIVWRTVQDELPSVRRQVQRITEEMT